MGAGQSELCVGRTAAQQPRWSAPLCAFDNTLRSPWVCLCSPSPLRPDARSFLWDVCFCSALCFFVFYCWISNLTSGYETEMQQNILFCSTPKNRTPINQQEPTVHSQMFSYQNISSYITTAMKQLKTRRQSAGNDMFTLWVYLI